MVVLEKVMRLSCLRMLTLLASCRGPCIGRGRATYPPTQLFLLLILFHLTREPPVLYCHPTFILLLSFPPLPFLKFAKSCEVVVLLLSCLFFWCSQSPFVKFSCMDLWSCCRVVVVLLCLFSCCNKNFSGCSALDQRKPVPNKSRRDSAGEARRLSIIY